MGLRSAITDYPKDIKAFYMRENDDGKTVAACDMLVPGEGEIIGGSQREERYDRLLKKMEEAGNQKGLEWYLDTRRYGGCIHSGFGIGFDRLLMYLTGVKQYKILSGEGNGRRRRNPNHRQLGRGP